MNKLQALQRVLVHAFLEVVVSDVEYEEAIAIVKQMLQEEPVAWGRPDAAGNILESISPYEKVTDMKVWADQYHIPLYTHPASQVVPVDIPTEVTEVAQKAIAAMLKEYNYPANTNNAARAGWRACRLHVEAMKGAA